MSRRQKPFNVPLPHALYNLGNSAAEELARFIEAIETACGRVAVREMYPMQPGDVSATYADITASTRDLGFNPATPMEQGIGRFVEWYRAQYGG